MSLNRRQFVEAGLVSAAGIMSASCKWWCPWCTDPQVSSLAVNIKGLILVERFPKTVTLHLVDWSKVGLMVHQPYLSVPAALIDSSGTSAPSITDPKDPSMRLFDVTNKTLTLDPGNAGGPDLGCDDDPIDENVPADDNHWKSVMFSARLRTLCGASKISDRSKFVTSLALEHGHLHSIKPDTTLGQQQIWEFTRTLNTGATQKVVKQVMTNTLVCDVPLTSPTAKFMIGGQPLALTLMSPGAVTLRNMPPPDVMGVCKGTPPCVDHMEVFYDLVDFAFKPTAKAANIVATGTSAEPDYCPPASI
jgi:hypothetical protein